ncbi:MAG: bifunctional deaminase-reductase domain protein [Acidimicrobiales bacterium]|nr:bifunctional deaminase-reductase domain protein [Acidimicrobiales bacterium]
MRSLTATMFLTLDGVYQGPGGPTEDPSGGFEHGGWSVTYWDEIMGERMGEWMGKPFDLLLGRTTYEIFASYWPHVSEESEEAETAAAINGATKHVASTTLDMVEWSGSHLIIGDVAHEVAKLKQQDGPEIQVHGSGNLMQTLLMNGLIDRLRVWVFPVLLGSGKRLFGDGTTPSGLEMVDSTTSTTGVVILTYAPGGELRYGSF